MENLANVDVDPHTDPESEVRLAQMAEQEQVLAHRISDVRTALVVLSARGLVYDIEALRQKIMISYPDVVVFFQSTGGKPLGPAAPEKVDLLIDFTGPGQRQSWLQARKFRRMARIAVGRNAGLFRKKIYDRIFDETLEGSKVPRELLQRERYVQKKIINLAGVAFYQSGQTPPDLGKTIPLKLPSMQSL